jgi:DNA-binding phage protein
MARRPKTGFDRYFEARMGDPAFAAVYRSARAGIDATDQLVRALDEARTKRGLTKAELARRIEATPEFIRRLLTAPGANPTMSTVLKVATALGYHLELVPDGDRSGGRRATPRRTAARQAGRGVTG